MLRQEGKKRDGEAAINREGGHGLGRKLGNLLAARGLRAEEVRERKLLCKHRGLCVCAWGLLCAYITFCQHLCDCAEAAWGKQGSRVLGRGDSS